MGLNTEQAHSRLNNKHEYSELHNGTKGRNRKKNRKENRHIKVLQQRGATQ